MNETEEKSVSPGTYIFVWFGLIVLTVITVTAAGLELGKWSVLAAILIAGAKSSLVLFHYMNLKSEDTVFKIMLTVALLTLVIILLLTYVDVFLR